MPIRIPLPRNAVSLMLAALLFLLLPTGPLATAAQRKFAPQPRPDAAIRRVLSRQVEAWNRGDMDAFLSGYADSDQTLSVGKHFARGYAAIAASYRQSYPTRQTMGKLAFSELEVHQLDQDYAVVIGKFTLKRSSDAGGGVAGVFSLVFDKTAQGWKIVLDHTS
ncbi:MAG: YybH family protein [Acidobacteriaceae bacterium]